MPADIPASFRKTNRAERGLGAPQGSPSAPFPAAENKEDGERGFQAVRSSKRSLPNSCVGMAATGMRDENAPGSALHRAQDKTACGQPDVFDLAAGEIDEAGAAPFFRDHALPA